MKIPEFYKRELYLDRIKPFVNTQMIKVLTGQRRVGKSFLIFQLMDYIRLSYATSMELIQKGMDRIEQFVKELK